MTGFHQNWMRDYDPTTGRYLQADPLGLVDGAAIYNYARQNPHRYTDPRGEQSISLPGPVPLPIPLPPAFTPGTPEAKGLGQQILDLSRRYNPIDLLAQSIVEMCSGDDPEASRCEAVRQVCHRNCVDYYVKGLFQVIVNLQDIAVVCVNAWRQEIAHTKGGIMNNYERILAKVDEFGPLITELSELLQLVEDTNERRKYRRALGEAMGALDGEIAYPIRTRLGITWKE